MSEPRLSIVISTRNRADYIGETLDSILPQLTPEVELLVFDGASTDTTPELLARYAERYSQLRIIRAPVNSGIDVDYDKAVQAAYGTYCWLMTDDDLFVAGAVATVLDAIEGSIDAIVVGVEDVDLTTKYKLGYSGTWNAETQNEYGSEDATEFFVQAAWPLSFIGRLVVRRAFWLSRDRSSFFGTYFAHVGLIFQQPPVSRARILVQPLVLLRHGNQSWKESAFEIWMLKWPELIWNLPGYPDSAKKLVTPKYRWRNIKTLFAMRARGNYDHNIYNKVFAHKKLGLWRFWLIVFTLIPGVFCNFVYMSWLLVRRKASYLEGYILTNHSVFANAGTRLLARLARVAWRDTIQARKIKNTARSH